VYRPAALGDQKLLSGRCGHRSGTTGIPPGDTALVNGREVYASTTWRRQTFYVFLQSTVIRARRAARAIPSFDGGWPCGLFRVPGSKVPSTCRIRLKRIGDVSGPKKEVVDKRDPFPHAASSCLANLVQRFNDKKLSLCDSAWVINKKINSYLVTARLQHLLSFVRGNGR
jgi:hypothetical protein